MNEQWWICTNQLTRGGKKILGPFESKELALEVLYPGRNGSVSDLNYGVAYSPARAIAAEGARVGFITCQSCGAALLLDPAEPVSAERIHTGWHAYIARALDDLGDDIRELREDMQR